ncbi:MAG TPA: peptidoglycan-binding domain-containing protein [Jiangellales bacterium]|nr:peptidoglycan-binding domain-containing protein [Jiangellales bacterium]
MTTGQSEILERLTRGESIEAIVESLRPPSVREALKRCAAASTFDRPLFESVLATHLAEPACAPFDEVVRSPDVEPVPRSPGTFRLDRESRSRHWKAWWSDEPGVKETELPTRLRSLARRLVDHFETEPRPLDQLALLSLLDTEAAITLFTSLYRDADERFDLASCQDIVNVLADEDRSPIHGRRLIEVRNDRAVYLRARSLWSSDFLHTASYLEPPDTMATYEALLTGHDQRVLQLHGPGGRGKTMELRWLIARQLVPERPHDSGPMGSRRIPCARMDFDFIDPVHATKTPWLVLLDAGAQLNQQLPGAPFNEFLETYGWATPLLRLNPPDTGRVEAASKRLHAEGAGLADVVPPRFARALNEAVGAKPVLLAFDTLEEIHLRPQGDLAALLGMLRLLIDRCQGLALILCGRYDIRTILGSAADALPPMNDRPLGNFSTGDAHRYLELNRRIPRKSTRDAIVTKVGGDPFKLSVLADLVEQRPSISPAAIARYDADLIYLILRVISRIENPRIRWLLRYGVVPRSLTLEFVHAVMERYLRQAMAGRLRHDSPSDDVLPAALAGEDAAFRTDLLSSPRADLDIEALWNQLRRYAGSTSWVFPVPSDPDSLGFHPIVLRPMRRILSRRRIYQRLHRDAARYFEHKAKSDPSRWDRWMRESIYHRFQLDGPDAARHWHKALDRVLLDEPERREALAADLLGPDYVDDLGAPLPWDDTRSIISPETLIEAQFERASALTQMARVRSVSTGDQLWSRAQRCLDAVEVGQATLRRPVIPEWRLAYVRAAVAMKDGQLDVAERHLRAALPRADIREDRVRLRLLFADAQLSRLDPAAPSTYRQALRSSAALTSAHRWQTPIRMRLVAAFAELDKIAQAQREYALARADAEDGLNSAQLTELLLRGGELGLRSGHLSWAEQTVEPVTGPAGDATVTGFLVRMALAIGDPLRALRAASRLVATTPGAEPSLTGAWGQELFARATGALMTFEPALTAWEKARTFWHAEGDLEGVVRCYAASARLLTRDVGDLALAEHHLSQADDVTVAAGGDAWLDRALARVELLRRQARHADAAARSDATITDLTAHWAPPRRLVRAAVTGLALGTGDRQRALLDLVADQLRRVTPAATRLTLLRGLDQVPGLADQAARQRLAIVRGLLRIGRDELLSPRDRALLEMTLVEVDRLCGNPRRAETRLHHARKHLPTPFCLHDWARAMDRLEPSTPSATIQDFVRQHRPYPMLCAAFLVERAEKALEAAGGDRTATRLLHQAEPLLHAASAEQTQWAPRWQAAMERAAQRGKHRPQWVTTVASAAAGAVFAALGDLVRAAIAPPKSPDDSVADLESSRGRIRLTLAGADNDLNVRVALPGRVISTARLSGQAPPVSVLIGKPRFAGSSRYSFALANRLCADWTAVGRELGAVLFVEQDTESASERSFDLRLEIDGRRLNAVPWELAIRPGTDGLAVATEPIRTVYRARSPGAAKLDEIAFVQHALNRLIDSHLPVDGDGGPITTAALRDYQRRRGLAANGKIGRGLFDRLQDELTEPGQRAFVVLAQPSSSRQVEGLRGKASRGLNLRRLYERYGFDVIAVENPTLDRLSRAIAAVATITSVRPVLHLSGGLKDSAGGAAFTFLPGGWESQAFSGSTLADELPVTALDRLLAPFPRTEPGPLVVLDVDRPSGITDTMTHLMLRNSFGAEVFALSRCGAVIATGLVDDAGYDLYETMIGALAGGRSVAEATAAIRRNVLDPREKRVERVVPLAGMALFTHLPWLRVTPRELDGGDHAAR